MYVQKYICIVDYICDIFDKFGRWNTLASTTTILEWRCMNTILNILPYEYMYTLYCSLVPLRWFWSGLSTMKHFQHTRFTLVEFLSSTISWKITRWRFFFSVSIKLFTGFYERMSTFANYFWRFRFNRSSFSRLVKWV